MLLVLCVSVMAQSVTLTFTGKDANNNRVQLDRVSITNLTKGWQETIYWPDTTLTMQNGTGIDDYANNDGFSLLQNNPNPFSGSTDVLLMVGEVGAITMEITDVNGRLVVGVSDYSLQAGTNQFRVTLSSAGAYVMTARCNGKTSSIKMVNNGSGNDDKIEYVSMGNIPAPKSETRGNTTNPFNFGDMMEYVGYATINGAEYESERISQMQGASQTFTLVFEAVLHTIPSVTTAAISNITGTSATVGGNVTSDGEETVFDRGICYSTVSTPTVSDNCIHIGQGTGSFSDVLTGLLSETTYYVRAFAINSIGVGYGSEVGFTTTTSNTPQDGQPCSGTPTLTDIDGNVYNTVQIGQQCWMKENLRTTKYADNTVITPLYAPNNAGTNVATYGYLYNWSSVMHGAFSSNANPSGVQGICPNGWHVPSDAEWTQLTDYVSSQNEYVCGNDNTQIAKAMAAATGWNSTTVNCAIGNNQDNNNITEFSAIPAGYYHGVNEGFGNFVDFWSSTERTENIAWLRLFAYDYTNVAIDGNNKSYGFSVRCVRDEGSSAESQDGQPCPNNATVIDVDGNVYNTVQIGSQCWMKENLRTTKYADNTVIPAGNANSETSPLRYAPNNDETNVLVYGYLYNWPAVMHGASSSDANPSGVQGICPNGWHVPSDIEWRQLIGYVISQDYVCDYNLNHIPYFAKALADITGWNSCSGNCTVGNDPSSNNATGFSGIPAGFYNIYGYDNFGASAYFWSATEENENDVLMWYIDSCARQALQDGGDTTIALAISVRCVKD